MKKYIAPIFIVSIFVVCAAVFGFGNRKTAIAQKNMVYVTDLNEVTTNITECDVLDFGFCFEVASNDEIKTKNTASTLGHSVVYSCSKNQINRILGGIGFVENARYKIEDVIVFEGKIARGKRVQIAYSNGKLTIGMPVIFGSY